MSGRKYDQDKPPVGRGFLGYFRRAIEVVALVSKFGKEKYDTEYEEKNWTQVEGARLRYRDAAARHLALDAGGEYLDPESGKPHLAHAAWCMLAALELDLCEEEEAQAKIDDAAVADMANWLPKAKFETGQVVVSVLNGYEFIVSESRFDPKVGWKYDVWHVRLRCLFRDCSEKLFKEKEDV